MPAERRIAGDRRQVALAPALVGLLVQRTDAEREGRIGVEEKTGFM